MIEIGDCAHCQDLIDAYDSMGTAPLGSVPARRLRLLTGCASQLWLWLGAPTERPAHWHPSLCLGCSS